MINKLDLTSVISKYYLNGMVEAVKWDIQDENMVIKFNAPTKEMIGRVEFNEMPLEDSTIAISNTTQLNKLIGITNGYLLGDAGEWNIEAPLDNESINAIVKAKSALAESETVVIKPYENADGEFQIEMQFGGNVEHANKVSFYIPGAETTDLPDNFKEHYNSNMIKEIMYCNKDMVGGTISINLEGIMKLEFQNDSVKSTYYLVSKEI